MSAVAAVKPVHTEVRGRARYKVEGLYRSESLKDYLNTRLSEREEIVRASASALTGKVLVLYDSCRSPQAIAFFISDVVSDFKKGNGNSGHASRQIEPYEETAPRDDRAETVGSRRRLRRLITHAEEQPLVHWHLRESADVTDFFDTSGEYGLTGEAAGARLKRYGPNVLPESVPRSGLSILFEQVRSLPVALLGIAAALSAFTGGLADAAVILGVVGINAVIGYVTESQAERTIHSLKRLVRPSAHVVREGGVKEIRAEEVVPGDMLVVRPGSYVVADCRLCEAHHLSVDESALTGESMPVIKTHSALFEERIPIADRVNMLYMGTLVTGGQGLAVVVATGKFTELGRIQTLVGATKPPETPMERELRTMGNQLVLISSAVCGLVFLTGLLRGRGLLEMLKTSIALAVAAVPEGLPTVATTTLALGIRGMRRHNVLIRHLDAVETLGAVQTICLDKTGTITMNRMTVVAAYAGNRRFEVSEGVFLSEGKYVNPHAVEELLKLVHISVLCNETEVGMQEGEYVLRGTSTENALIHMAVHAGVDSLALRRRFPLLKVTHRSENRNFMMTVHELISNGRLIAVKGSPVEVLAMCRWHIKDGKVEILNEEDRLSIETENERMAGEALRVLGVAYRKVMDDDEEDEDGFTWLGLAGMADPTRKGVKGLIEVFHRAGINTVMITGDQSPTAYAVGRSLDLSGGRQLEILDSTHLAGIEPEVIQALCERVHVFSRVSPAHKLQIVQALQGAGKVVAMTGDGINDGPALKAADIGIAMGTAGTDVAREIADVVLEDDNLETMVIAIGRGRTIYGNIRKSLHFLLATNMSEIMVTFAAMAAGMGQPLSAMQLLWINLMSDIFPGLALALEPPEPDVMSRPPRDPREPIIKAADFKRLSFESAVLSAGALGAYGYGIMRYGRGPAASTMAFMSLTVGQLLHSISCRSERHSILDRGNLPPNQYLNAALGGSLALQVLAAVVPGIRGLLGIAPLGLIDYAVAGGAAAIPLLVNETTKKKAGGEGR